ncbi:hypothetical protein [Leifsonia sp. WHRI 6310E]|uniref:HNH endonuclease n=1 Tax=Leifsonia sp. WHRI 6310E TaxID=3162562 RepID=UPI0032EE7398
MPYAPGTRCSDPSCGDFAVDHGKCLKHRRKAWENPSQHTLQIDPAREREWRKLVKAKTNGMCAWCAKPGAVCDHIVPVGEGGALYDPANGQYLCTDHDRDKTTTDLARMSAKRRSNVNFRR